jgi:aminoglycoside phosphotransferase (APT) family kinase protein
LVSRSIAKADGVSRSSSKTVWPDHKQGRGIPRVAGCLNLGVTADSEFSSVPVPLMEFVDGLVVDTMEVAEALTPKRRRQIAQSAPSILAKIQAVDLVEVGLGDLASHKPYVQRQLGDRSAATTLDVYADLIDTDLDAVAQAFDKSCAQNEPEGGPITL